MSLVLSWVNLRHRLGRQVTVAGVLWLGVACHFCSCSHDDAMLEYRRISDLPLCKLLAGGRATFFDDRVVIHLIN